MPSTPRPLDPAACYAALQARDARFDGHWFTGVTSTGVYCRPICRVRTPKAENCRFFPHAAAAESAGFRPCLKCRPELAPRSFSVMEASRSLAHAARERLDAAARHGEGPSLEALAKGLGVTARHLRRIFADAFGVSPLAYLQTQRLLTAKQLLTDTQLPLASVAAQAGFGSTRAFQDAWSQQYRLAPLQLRKQAAQTAAPPLTLSYRPPYAVPELLSFLAVRAIPGVEDVDQARRRVRRTVRAGTTVGQLAVEFDADLPRVRLHLSDTLWPHAAEIQGRVRQWLDLDADPDAIAQRLAALRPTPGLRLAGGVDRFELAVRAVLGQQVTVAAARTVSQRVVQAWGQALPDAQGLGEGQAWLFPTPQALAHASAEAVAACGMPLRRAQCLVGLAQAWPALRMAQPTPHDPDAAEAELQQLAGIGPWTAAYIRMRAWPWPDRFLPGDGVLRQQLALDPHDPSVFAPYRSYAVLQLWQRATLAKAPS